MARERNGNAPEEFFKENQAPDKIFFYKGSRWLAVPGPVLTLAQERFQAKHSCLEIAAVEGRFILDLFAKVLVNETTGERKPLGWVDKGGRYFFPYFQVPQIELPPPVPEPTQTHQSMSMTNALDAFLTGMENYESVLEIRVRPMTGHLWGLNVEIFDQAAEAVRQSRGDPNIVFAWSPAPPISLERSLICEFPGHFGTTCYGFGALLSHLENPHISAFDCEADEDGVYHVVLCRVALGNVEVVRPPNQQQTRPSSDDFDSAVDSLYYPRRYLIWCSNMNTHIYPEYLVSFKLPEEDSEEDDDDTEDELEPMDEDDHEVVNDEDKSDIEWEPSPPEANFPISSEVPREGMDERDGPSSGP